MPNIISNASSYLVLSVRTLINVGFSILWAGVNRVALVDHISSLSLLFPLGLGMDFGDLLPTCGSPPDPENKYRNVISFHSSKAQILARDWPIESQQGTAAYLHEFLFILDNM